MDALAERQLAALDEVAGMLGELQVDYWLFGGWAVDLYVGKWTRPHDDIDVAVWLSDVPRIREALFGKGWTHAPEAEEDGGTGFEHGDVRLELTYLERDPDGRTVIPLSSGPVLWELGPGDVCELQGVRARVIALSTLTEGKSFPRDDADDNAKDRADHERLIARVSEQHP